MKPLLGQPKGLVETLGYMHGFRGVQKGGDLQWVVGAPVIDKDGKRKGQLVTGWSFRRYAGLLEGNARRHAQKQAEDEKNKHPLIYVFLLHKDKAFGGPITPDVNAAKIAALGIPAKVSGKAVFQTTLEIEKRDFAIAARAVPALGKDVAVAVLVAVL